MSITRQGLTLRLNGEEKQFLKFVAGRILNEPNLKQAVKHLAFYAAKQLYDAYKKQQVADATAKASVVTEVLGEGISGTIDSNSVPLSESKAVDSSILEGSQAT